MRVQVTAADIEKGTRRVADCCPVALAIKRAAGASDVVVRGSGSLTIMGPGRYGSYRLPSDVLAWVFAFDTGQQVQPFEFEVVVP